MSELEDEGHRFQIPSRATSAGDIDTTSLKNPCLWTVPYAI
jgi:hypothetical protein